MRNLITISYSVLLGNVTHLLLDGISHRGQWPARIIFPNLNVSLLGMTRSIENWVWILLSVVGAFIVWAVMIKHFPARDFIDIRKANLLLGVSLTMIVLGLLWAFYVERILQAGIISRAIANLLFISFSVWRMIQWRLLQRQITVHI
jgi:hypothetical protein